MLMSNSTTGVIDKSVNEYARPYNDKNFPQKYDLIFERLPFAEAILQHFKAGHFASGSKIFRASASLVLAPPIELSHH